MNRPDLELPEGFEAAIIRATGDIEAVDWRILNEDEKSLVAVAFWHGAIWRQKLLNRVTDQWTPTDGKS